VAQGYPPRRPAGLPADGRHGRPDEPGRRGRPGRDSRPRAGGWDQLDAFDDHLDEATPPWAGPGIHPTAPAGRQRRPPRDPDGPVAVASPDGDWPPDGDEDWAPDERAEARPGRRAAARARKSRRRLLVGCGAVAVVAVIAAAVLWVTRTWPFQGTAAPAASSPVVTTFQRGEFRSVPNACSAVSPALLSQYLPGKVSRVSQALGSATQSQCTWTLDHRPDFRVLAVSSQAYAPSLLASGDGSATFSAIDAYGQTLQGLQNPPKGSKQPPAQLGTAVGLGRDAFTALQVFHVAGVTTDEVTVVIRDRNVLIDVTMQGPERGGHLQPVPVATLRAAALAAAHEVLAGLG
jgi:hypothetical protein